MKTRKIVSTVLAILMLLFVFGGCESNELKKGVNLDGPNKAEYIGCIKEGSDGMDLVGAAGVKVSSDTVYGGYIGHGYDVINSPYYSQEYIKSGCVLDVDKMVDDGIIYIDPQNGMAFKTVCGETLSSYSKQFGASAGAEVKGLFSASLNVDFGLTDKVESNKSFAKGSIVITKTHEYVNSGNLDFNILRSYVTKAFTSVLESPEWTPEEIFKTYGTHIMLSVYLGGRLDMSFVYNSTNNESSQSLSSMLQASYNTVSGHASVEDKETHRYFTSNSTFNLKACGGNPGFDMQTFEKAQANLKDWQNSIINTENASFIQGGDIGNPLSMVPIWRLIDLNPTARDDKETQESVEKRKQSNLERYEAIIQKYTDMLMESGSFIDGAQVAAPQQYIKDIYMGIGDTPSKAKADLLNKSRENIHIINGDLNAGIRRTPFIYLGYTLTTDVSEALTNIIFRTEFDAPSTWSGWAEQADGKYKEVKYTYRPYDCNEDAAGEYIYMYYTHDAWADTPITDLYVEISGDLSGRSGSTGWERAKCYNLGGDMDLNMGSGGAYVYLWVRH